MSSSLLALGALLGACRETKPAAPPLFELLDSTRTGVTFVNAVPETAESNLVNYLYYYNGGGVAVGDVNGDGLVDLYLSSNIGSNHLYLNRGNYRFEDVTDHAGVAGPPGWKTGVTMADVNGDGRADIYVCAVDRETMHGHNALYINNGDGTFTDRTKEFGLDFAGYATQALFFDYDGDGDLDMYLLNNSTHAERVAALDQVESRNPRVSDRLYRNDGGHFSDVSERAGIHAGIDYGLGVVASDFNGDGCIDLYVANDFQENDYLYVNNCDGTFRDSIGVAMGHTSQFSMGVDAADVNNDLRPDVFVADMLPDSERVRKTSVSAEPYSLYARRIEVGYRPQLSRNTLQLNRGALRFSDVAPFAGVAATDWSWAPLLADFDNDGRKDLFITSGIYRRPNDLTYLAYATRVGFQNSRADSTLIRELIARMPHAAAPDQAFRNAGDLHFDNVSVAWGVAQPGFSNGAAYADLTNSGRLDLVVNRINAPAAIYRNTTAGHYLTVQLRGSGGNTLGIGAKVIAVAGGVRQLAEQMPTRGFQSSVDPRLHFGLGATPGVDSLVVIWPDGRTQSLVNVASDRIVTLVQDSARARTAPRLAPAPVYVDVTATSGLAYRHEENDFVDFTREPLIPHVVSAEGPALAVGDVNGDGLDDVFVGGAKWKRGALFLQQREGRFRRVPAPAIDADSLSEDVDAVFFDANGDGNVDLYVVSGGNEFEGDDAPLQDRLYLNDGAGHFRRDSSALPVLRESGASVAVGDFDGDGHPDLFVGRRSVARHYGVSPRSYLLRNDGRGHFTDVTDSIAPGLAAAGMVAAAVWTDYDADGKLDLVVTGEWMPVRVFHQEGGRFVERTREVGLAGSSGWWRSVAVADVDGNGRPDLVLGNIGENTMLRATPAHPAQLYVGHFDARDTSATQAVLSAFVGDASYPVASRDELLQAIPQLADRFRTYEAYASATIENVLTKEMRRSAVLEARTLASAIAMNTGRGFTIARLPSVAQLTPVNAALVADFDGDGRSDLLVGGNLFGMAPVLGRQDAATLLLLRGAPGGNFAPVELQQSGFALDGEVRHLARVRTAKGYLIVVARNNDSVRVFRRR